MNELLATQSANNRRWRNDVPEPRMAMILVGVLGLLGCGAATTHEGTDLDCPVPSDMGCARPQGIYTTTSTERAGGTCGRKASTTVRVSTERVMMFYPPCAGTVIWSDDFCMASFEASCPEDEIGPGYVNQQVSHTTYSVDAMTRTGVFEVSIFDAEGNLYCESTYDSATRNTSCD